MVGCGRVGLALGARLRDAGHPLVGVVARSAASRAAAEQRLPGVPILGLDGVVEIADLVLLTVSDDAIVPLVTELSDGGLVRPGQFVAHTSGRFGWRVLEPIVPFRAIPLALHPAMTFVGEAGDHARIAGCCFAISAPHDALATAASLVERLGATPVVVADEDRPLYHAALVHGANHLVTLVAQALDLLRSAGIANPEQLLRPLVEAALGNTLRLGDRALSGPVARGDAETVAAHVAALAAAMQRATGLRSQLIEDTSSAYRVLAASTAARAVTSGVLAPERAIVVRRALEPN